jgi:hypothetical protein
VTEHEEQDPGPETVMIGRFNPLELPLILEALHARGIFAMTKSPLGKPDNEQYGVLGKGREVLLVDRDRAVEARQIIDSDLRPQISEMSDSLSADSDVDFEAAGLVPIGWLEPEVARELLRVLGNAGVRAEPEYSLDAPPPPYARGDGRVRVHVEELLFDEAVEMLEKDVVEGLASRGITPAEPLRGEDE